MVKFKISDALNNPVPGVAVYPQTEYLGIMNVRVPNELFKTDSNGETDWRGAPDVAVKMTAYADDFMQEQFLLEPEETEKIIHLASSTTINGHVYEKGTKKLIATASIRPGVVDSSVTPFRTNWLEAIPYGAKLSEGEFRLVVPPENRAVQATDIHLFRIEASGFCTFVSDPIARSKKNVHQEIELVPSETFKIQVFDSNRNIAAGGTVYFVQEKDQIIFWDKGFSRFNKIPGGEEAWVNHLNQDGEILINQEDVPRLLVIQHGGELAWFTPDEVRKQPMLYLKPMGSLEINFESFAQNYSFELEAGPLHELSSFKFNTHSIPRAQKYFSVNAMPPGKHRLIKYRGNANEPDREVIREYLLEIVPGKKTVVDNIEELPIL